MPGHKPTNGEAAPVAPANSPKKPTNGTPTSAPMTFSTGAPTAAPVRIPAPIRAPGIFAAPARNLSREESSPAPVTAPKLPTWAAAAGLRSFHKGGTVPETAPAMLKKGELVLTPDQNEKLKHAIASIAETLGEPDEKQSEVKEMAIRRSSNDGFIVQHIADATKDGTAKNDEHVYPTLDDLKAHIEEVWGDPDAGKDEDADDEVSD